MSHNPAQVPSRHSHLGLWVLSFLLIILTLTLVATALYFFQEQTNDGLAVDGNAQARIQDLEQKLTLAQQNASSLQEEVQNLTEELQVSDVVTGAIDRPAFHYPADWNIARNDVTSSGALVRTYALDEDLIYFCDACGARPGEVLMRIETNPSIGTGVSYIDGRTTEIQSGAVTGGSVTYTDLSNGRLMKVEGARISVLGVENFYEQIIFETDARVINIQWTSEDGLTEEGWNEIKTSLDFSTIE